MNSFFFTNNVFRKFETIRIKKNVGLVTTYINVIFAGKKH